jgi:hypothetical protein
LFQIYFFIKIILSLQFFRILAFRKCQPKSGRDIELTIPGNPNATASVRMFNDAGQVVLQENIAFVDGRAQLDLSTFVSGSFVLEVKTATHVFYKK